MLVELKKVGAQDVGVEAGSDRVDSKGSRSTQLFDRIWGYGTLYENEEKPVLKKLALTGRFQVDFPLFDANRGDYSEDQVRRFRIGAKSRWATT